ncbi:hypothetical protein EKE94_00705 [Mesobaculum littorinae]|uniref:Uncharacterized protein n=1 Tax=Mesobaculum littorinae TaxID=2486419 RepID=A0A438AKA9_9RHOB|nr:hypothetical protein [Mesobaculum littorinae]RVV99251.1 hypothetical protein EKE94_00705 [Mesobaculum littorinae]
MPYLRFALTIAVATAIAFALTYLPLATRGHALFSQTQAWTALALGAATTAVCLGGTLGKRAWALAAVLMVLAVAMVRTQVWQTDTGYLRGLVPQSSAAILASSRAPLADPRVQAFADELRHARAEEIARARYLAAELTAGRGGAARAAPDVVRGTVVEALEAGRLAEVSPDPMDAMLAETALGGAGVCHFRFSGDAAPVFWARGGDTAPRGVIRLNDVLVPLSRAEPLGPGGLAAGGLFAAQGARVRIRPLAKGSGWLGGPATLAEMVVTIFPNAGDPTGDAASAGTPADAAAEAADGPAGHETGYIGLYTCDEG